MDLSVPFWLATGGADGYVRIWNASNLLKIYGISVNEEIYDFDEDKVEPKNVEIVRPEIEISVRVGGEVDDLDVSSSGEILSTISGKEAALWKASNGDKLMQLPEIPQIANLRVFKKKFFYIMKSFFRFELYGF